MKRFRKFSIGSSPLPTNFKHQYCILVAATSSFELSQLPSSYFLSPFPAADAEGTQLKLANSFLDAPPAPAQMQSFTLKAAQRKEIHERCKQLQTGRELQGNLYRPKAETVDRKGGVLRLSLRALVRPRPLSWLAPGSRGNAASGGCGDRESGVSGQAFRGG